MNQHLFIFVKINFFLIIQKYLETKMRIAFKALT